MSIFSKPLTSLEYSDLNELLESDAQENIRLEFKERSPSKSEMMKKISSLANTYGGWIIVGAAEGDRGKLGSLPGVDEMPNYKQTLVQWTFECISPPIDIQVSDSIQIVDANGGNDDKFLYVIFVPESDLAPHFLNGRKGIYVRSDEYSQFFEPKMATLEEILRLTGRRQAVLDRRSLLIERAKIRFGSYAETSYAEYGRNPAGLGGNLSLVFSPRYPDRRLFDYASLIAAIHNQVINWRQVGFPRLNTGHLTQHESVLVRRPGSSFSLLEISLWGVLAYATELEIEYGRGELENRPVGIHLNHFLGQLLVFTEHAKRMLTTCGYLGPIKVVLSLNKIRGVPWIHFPDGFAEENAKSILDDSAIIDFEIDSQQIIESRDVVVMAFLREILFAIDWPYAECTDAHLQRLIRAGYEFNMWPPPNPVAVA